MATAELTAALSTGDDEPEAPNPRAQAEEALRRQGVNEYFSGLSPDRWGNITQEYLFGIEEDLHKRLTALSPQALRDTETIEGIKQEVIERFPVLGGNIEFAADGFAALLHIAEGQQNFPVYPPSAN